MKRRQLLLVGGVLVTTGCFSGSEDSTPTETPTTTATTQTPDAESLSDEAAFEELKARASEIDVSIVTTLVGDDQGAYFEYVDGGKDRAERENDVRALAKTYVSLVERGWDTEWLEAALVDEDEVVILSWLVEREWVDNYLSGEMTGEEVAENAVGTIL